MNDLEDEEIELKVEKDPLIGKKLAGRYEIVSVLGRGGMGVVYKAHQADVDRFVAIKTLHISKIADSQVIQKFRSEAQAVSRVRHPNTVMLYDFGVSQDGVPFLVMDILDGVSFRDVLKTNGALPLGRCNNIFQQVCAALAFAHENGIVHKDMKPENIMLCDRPGQADWVYVLDFGIAGLLESQNQQINEIIGSPPYMSPEQCTMQPADHRSDIYSLGICLFETLSGKFPFKARSAMEMLDCHRSQTPFLLKDMGPKFGTYESLSLMIARSLEKRPDKRHQSIQEFAMELEDAIKKDSKRGMQLRTRATMEVDTPRASEFVEKKVEEAEDDATEPGRNSRPKGLVSNIKALLSGDSSVETKDDAATDSGDGEHRYFMPNCPHCDAPTEAGISLCLACGRSLASKNDFSKIRASRGDFSLPKLHDLNATQSPQQQQQPTQSPRALSQKTRHAMLKSGTIWWTKTSGLMILTFLLMLSVFIAAGGGKFISKTFAHPGEPTTTAQP